MDSWLAFVYGAGYQGPRLGLARGMLEDKPDLLGDDAYLACAAGNEELLRRKLKADPDWVQRPGGPLGMLPLIAVTHSGLARIDDYADRFERCTKLLLEQGADANADWIDANFPEYPLSALYGAAGKNHHPGMTRLLLGHGANPNDNESLYHSVESSDLRCTQLLLGAGARVKGTNAVARVLDFDRLEGLRLLLAHESELGDGFLLHHAIRRGRSAEHIKMLLEAGADARALNAEGISPWRFALWYGMPAIAEILKQSGADERLSEQDEFVAACARADDEEAKRRIARTPDIFDRLSERQLKQLPELAAQGNRAGVKTMLEAGWPVEVKGGDWNASALNIAAFRGDAALTGLLLKHGANWEERHQYGGNVLGSLSYGSLNEPAEGGDWLECAKNLIAHGMPLPDGDHQFSEAIEEYFESLRQERGFSRPTL